MDTISVSQALQIAGRAGRYGTQYEKVIKFKKYMSLFSFLLIYMLFVLLKGLCNNIQTSRFNYFKKHIIRKTRTYSQSRTSSNC